MYDLWCVIREYLTSVDKLPKINHKTIEKVLEYLRTEMENYDHSKKSFDHSK